MQKKIKNLKKVNLGVDKPRHITYISNVGGREKEHRHDAVQSD